MGQSSPPAPADPLDLLRLVAQFTWRCGRDLRVEAVTSLDETCSGEAIHQIRGARLDRLVAKSLYAPERRVLDDALSRHSPFQDASLTLPDADGGTLNVTLSATPIRNSTGVFGGYFGIGRAGRERPFDAVQRQELVALLRRAEAARDREAQLRHESEVLLASLRILHQAVAFDEKCKAILAAFSPLLQFEAAIVVRRGLKGALRAVVSSVSGGEDTIWPEDPPILAALSGTASVHDDISTSMDAARLPPSLKPQARAALFVPLRIGTENAVVIALNSVPGAFSQRHLAVMQRFTLVAAQVFEAEDQKSAMINASKLATLGELLATIVHEINQPLSVISMAAQNTRLMVETNAPSNDVVEKLVTMDGQARRAGEIVKAIRGLAHSNRSVTALEDIALQQVIATLRVVCESPLRTKGITLDTQLVDGCRNVRARPGALEQVLLNLISNARDAILDRMARRQEKSGGRILISVEDSGHGEQLILRVSDNGGGIPDDVMERVFDPFFTLKEVGSGTGLGLSICRTLLSDMQGSLQVHNDADGAVFEIALNAVPDVAG